MSKLVTRRDFLKFSSLLFPGYLLSQRANSQTWGEDPDSPSILTIVHDAFAADHMSLYVYPRETTPNIARL